jgi:hypothetical protein
MPITNTAWVRALFCKLQKGCTRLATDKVCKLLAHGRWFFPGTPVSSTTKTGKLDRLTIYHSFILLNFYHWPVTCHFCSERNTKKMGKIQDMALKFIY